MKIKTYWGFALLLAAASCSPTNSKTEAVADSVATEPLQLTPTNASAAPIPNFPAYTLEILSSDSLEAKVSEGLEELLSEYNYRDYLTIQSHYLRERDYEGDFGKVTESEEVTETV